MNRKIIVEMSGMMDIKLNSNYTITGDIEGTWEKSYDSYIINVVLDNKKYRGVFLKQDYTFDKNDKFSFWKTPIYRFDFNQEGVKEICNKGNKYGNAELMGNARIIKDEEMGQVLEIKNSPNTKKGSYVKLPEEVFSEITHSGFCISTWVKLDSESVRNFTNTALFEANSGGFNKYPMTRISCNLSSRINSNGVCGDATRILGRITENTWHQVAYSVSTKGINVYLDGQLVCRESKDMTTCFDNNVLSKMTEVTLGSGEVWGDFDVCNARFKNVDIYDLALSEEEINYIYRKEKSCIVACDNNSKNENIKESNYIEQRIAHQSEKIEKKVEHMMMPVQNRNVPSNSLGLPNNRMTNNNGINSARSRNVASINENASTNPSMNSRNVNIANPINRNVVNNNAEINTVSNKNNNYPVQSNDVINNSAYNNRPANSEIEVPKHYHMPNTYDNRLNSVYNSNDSYELEDYNYNNRIDNDITEEANINNYEYAGNDINNYQTDNNSGVYSNEYINNRLVDRATSNFMDNNLNFTSTEINVGNAYKEGNYYDTNSSNNDYSSEYYNNNFVEDESIQYGYNGNTYSEHYEEKSQGIVSGYNTSGSGNAGYVTLGHDEIMRDENNIPVRNNWLIIEEKIYCTDENGKVRIGWYEYEDKSYHFNYIGQMDIGWLNDIDDKWYYLGEDGVKRTGWIEDANGRVYFLGQNGDMQIGWIKDEDGSWYYFYSNGEMAVNTIIDGYKIGWNGVCER